MMYPFHLAFPVRDLHETRRFYQEILGCGIGRAGVDWLDINFFGSQIVAHTIPDGPVALDQVGMNRIDGHEVPLPHFGCVLPWDEWSAMAQILRELQVPFEIEPHVRYAGEFNEQASMIFRDPSGNVIEFKSFRQPAKIFEQE